MGSTVQISKGLETSIRVAPASPKCSQGVRCKHYYEELTLLFEDPDVSHHFPC
jgi:hypothetical protein